MSRNESPIHSLRFFVQSLLFGYHGWGLLRLVILGAIGIGLSMIWGAVLERETLAATAESIKNNLPIFGRLPNPILILVLTPFHWVSLRFFLVPFFGFILAIFLSARYLQDIYNLSSLKVCLNYLVAGLFGIGYPTLKIGSSEESINPNASSYLPELGGPGYLDISPGFVVAVSRPKTTSNIYGEGVHFLLRSEKVEEVGDLNDQTDTIEAISAFSHEGVAIQLSDIHFGYRLKKSPAAELTSDPERALRPYTFSVQALRNLMQSRVMTEGGLTDWRSMVRGAIQTTIRDFIYQHTVSELIKPLADYNPYADLKKTFQSRQFRERLRNMGTELL
ncbi:MAG: SPFH domain-containing protein, partial [Anaerolineales bacterium]|nr:SPFH domain-containing protein [Anaerolineales bacterium]